MDSSQPRKQRKRHFSAPKHERQKKVSAMLSKELRKAYGKRSAPVRKGDTIKVMRGKHKGRSGEVTRVLLKGYRIHVKDMVVRKANGNEVPVPMHPSNVEITTLKLDDARRKAKFKEKGAK